MATSAFARMPQDQWDGFAPKPSSFSSPSEQYGSNRRRPAQNAVAPSGRAASGGILHAKAEALLQGLGLCGSVDGELTSVAHRTRKPRCDF